MVELFFKVEPGRQEVFTSCELDAPRDLVFRVFVDPALTPRWWGPRGLETRVETAEVHGGGRWRNIQTEMNGEQYAFHGVYHEVSELERIIRTFEFEGLPETGHVVLEITTFEELAGNRTLLREQSVYPSVAERDGMVEQGMQSGMRDSMERLAELLDEFQHKG